MVEDKETNCGIVINSKGEIIIQTGDEEKFWDNIDQLVAKLKDYCNSNNEEIALKDACLGVERFLSWKNCYREGMRIPQKILQELIPALEYIYEKEENHK